MSEAVELLRSSQSVLLIDWPSPEVPEALARAGLAVHVKNGPRPTDFAVRELQDKDVTTRATGRRPEHVDLVYVHRPLDELPRAVELARALDARAVWYQSGLAAPDTKKPRGCWLSAEDSQRARKAVETAGMRYIDDAYIVDALP